MKARRYKEQFRLGMNGEGKASAEYAGAYYAFPDPTGKRRAARLAAPVAAYWLAAPAYLKTAGVTGRTIYALVPFMLGLFPGVYALMGLFSMARAPARMTVVQRENGVGRVLRSALGCGVFSALGAIGAIVRLSLGGDWAAGWHEPMLMAIAACAGFTAFALARRDFRALRED